MENELTNNGNAEEHNLPQTGEIIGQYDNAEQYDKVLGDITQEINTIIEFANQSNDWRDIRSRLTDSKDKLKGLFLKETDNNKLLDVINDTIEHVNSRQTEEKQKLDVTSQENFNSVIDKVKEAVTQSAALTDFKKAREVLLSAQDLFKNLALKRSHRDELNNLIHEAFDSLTNRQIDERENYEMECIENYHNSKGIVDEAILFSQKSAHYGKAREALIEVQTKIKGLKLKREQRDELFQSIRDAFEGVNIRQETERSSFDQEAKDNYVKLKKIVEDAISFANSSEEFSESREQLINAQNAIKGMKLRRDHRDELYAQIRVVFEDLNEKQSDERQSFEQECTDNYDNLTKKVNDCFELVLGLTDFKMIRETLINVQSEVRIAKLKRGQRNELFARIREAFGIFDKKRDEFFSERRAERIEKLNDIKSNLSEKIERLNQAIESEKAELVQLEGKSAEEMDEFMKNETTQRITLVQGKISEKEQSIEQTRKRIEEVDADIAKIEKSKEDS
jgi:hypothetical protein